jgi:hypothetical protein
MRRGVFVAVLFVLGCEPERATVRILGASISREAETKKLVVDVDVEAHEGLGNNVGHYCVSVQWPFDPKYTDKCASDLEDGDTKSLRFVSEKTDHKPGELVRVRAFTSVQTGGVDLNAPP